jgi:hypothetical protein
MRELSFGPYFLFRFGHGRQVSWCCIPRRASTARFQSLPDLVETWVSWVIAKWYHGYPQNGNCGILWVNYGLPYHIISYHGYHRQMMGIRKMANPWPSEFYWLGAWLVKQLTHWALGLFLVMWSVFAFLAAAIVMPMTLSRASVH